MENEVREVSIEEFESKLNDMNIITELFDQIRLIDGPSKSICEIKNGEVHATSRKCHAFWNRSEKCKNCVSYRASQSQHKMVKLEFFDNQYYFVMACPFIIGGKNYILELISNITVRLSTDLSEIDPNDFIHNLICQLETASIKDSFTGLFNKKYLETKVEEVVALKKYHTSFLVMFDLDDFKLVNDTHGHILGDKVLLEFASVLDQDTKQFVSYIARFGGDEFSILFEDTTQEQVEEVLANIAQHFYALEFESDKGTFHVNVSAGYTPINEEINTFNKGVTKADEHLYAVKKEHKLQRLEK